MRRRGSGSDSGAGRDKGGRSGKYGRNCARPGTAHHRTSTQAQQVASIWTRWPGAKMLYQPAALATAALPLRLGVQLARALMEKCLLYLWLSGNRASPFGWFVHRRDFPFSVAAARVYQGRAGLESCKARHEHDLAPAAFVKRPLKGNQQEQDGCSRLASVEDARQQTGP